MVFLYPEYLWGLLTLLIPLIIHLFNFKRPRVVYFTNVAFLREVKSTATSRNRLRHWLILLARMLFLAMLVLAFARPVIPAEGSASTQAGGTKVSIYLDNSYSLQNERDGQRLLDAGKQTVEALSDLFPNSAGFQLMTNTPEGNQRYFYDVETLNDKLLETNFSTQAPTLEDTYQRQLRALNAQGGNGHQVFWLTDFQKSTLGDWQTLEIDSAYQHYLIPLQGAPTANLVVDSVWLENPFLQTNENNTLNVRLRNTGNEALENRLLQFFIENKQVASQSVSLEANSRRELQLNFAVTTSGEKAARIEVEDYPMTFDNKHYFTLSVAPQIRTITIGGDAEARYASRVFDNEPFFVHAYYEAENVDYNALSEADLIVLAHLPALNAALQGAITDFLADGGTVVVFPPLEVRNLKSYQNVVGYLPDRVSVRTPVRLDRPREGDPFYEGVFERMASNMDMPQTKPVLAWQGAPILRYRGGRTFLSRQKRAQGALYLFASSLQSDAGTFQKHALFVPTMYRIAFTSKRSLRPLSYPLDQNNLRLPVDSLRTNQIFQLQPLTEAGQPLIPGQRVLGNELILELNPSVLTAGHYALRRKTDQKTVALLAFNAATAESELEVLSLETLENELGKYPNVQLYEGEEALDIVRSFRDQNLNNPLWRYFIWAALLALLAEVLLIRFWRGG